MQPVTVNLTELKNGLLFSSLEKAFGKDSLGILVVEQGPEFEKLRIKVLESLSVLANLPKSELEQLESPESLWLTGWSCGREVLQDSKPDFHKGSFYVNCAFHKDPKLEGPRSDLVDRFTEYKTYTTPNIWPQSDKLPTFEADCKELCNCIIDVAELVAANCDRYISSYNDTYEPGFLQRVIKTSTCSKARFLHYFPSTSQDNWCGEHVDHSCLTGLTSALYIDETNGSIVKNPDPNAGLYIKSRNGESTKVAIPANCLAFQSGSALESISRGSFKAVPHHVRGTDMNIARNTLAVFCQPDLDEPVNETEHFAHFADRIVRSNQVT